MNNRYRKRSYRRSQLSRRILLQYIAALAAFGAMLALMFFLGLNIYHSYSFQRYDFIYILAQIYAENFLLFTGIIFFTGWAFITYYFINKPLRYLDEAVDAAAHLANNPQEPVKMSNAMKGTEDELNLVREQALRNALLAKESEQRKNDLIVYLAHDLKTPLTSVIGYLTLIKDEPQISLEQRSRYMGIALDKAQRLEDLINEFFDITRFSLTSLKIEPERVNMSRMLEQIASEFNPVLAEKGLSWNLMIEPNLETFCDPDKMERVFDNLIRNAINYSYPETEITLSLSRTANTINLQVQNRGKTIPPEKLSKIFEQFFRLDSSRATSTGGAGLGLAIAKEIVELHGGRITVESANESILFTVTLPR